MSDTPFMKLWIGDFSRDTAHLSQKEIGQYILLLMVMWGNNGTLPSDPSRLRRIARGKVSEAVMSYFDDDGQGGITQKRLQKELKKARDLSAKQKQNIDTRWSKNKDLADTTVVPDGYRHSHSHSHSQKKEKKERESGAVAPLPSEKNFEIFWNLYPHKVGKRDALKAFLSSLQRAPLSEILDGVRRYIRTKPPDRPWCNPATFLNQDRWLDVPGPEPQKQSVFMDVTERLIQEAREQDGRQSTSAIEDFRVEKGDRGDSERAEGERGSGSENSLNLAGELRRLAAPE
jgi:uncharacterized protein YdaU (DUF1376 family)